MLDLVNTITLLGDIAPTIILQVEAPTDCFPGPRARYRYRQLFRTVISPWIAVPLATSVDLCGQCVALASSASIFQLAATMAVVVLEIVPVVCPLLPVTPVDPEAPVALLMPLPELVDRVPQVCPQAPDSAWRRERLV